MVVNSEPVLSGLSISPSDPSSSDQLTCAYVSSDADGETLTETITWTNVTTGVLLGTGASVQLSSNTAVDGDVVQCLVESSDSDVTVSSSSTVTVVNTAPEFTSAALKSARQLE